MTSELAFKNFEIARLDQQRALFADCFPETIGQPTALESHYRWKFHSFPAKPTSYEYGAHLEGEMIGYYAAIPFEYRVGGERRVAGMVCDVMTGSRARGKGVFTKMGAHALAQMKDQGVDFTTGYPIRPEVLPGHLKVGWKVVQTMPIYLRVLRTRALLDSKKLGFLAPLGDLAALGFKVLPRVLRGNTHTVQLMTVNEFLEDPGYPAFLEQWLQGVPNGLVKSRDFLRWRLGAPQTSYRVVVARDRQGTMVGVCITRNTELSKVPTLALLDVMLLRGHERAFRALDHQLQKLALESGADVIATMMEPGWARQYGLPWLSYLRSPFVFSLIVRKLNEALDDSVLFDARRWHTMWIDSDDL
jgi:GNAT superfamily N-acetyltransferase